MTKDDSISEVALYTAASGAVEVRVEGENVWLRQEQLAALFGRDRTVIGRHVRNVFGEGELAYEAVCANFAHTAADGELRPESNVQNLHIAGSDKANYGTRKTLNRLLATLRCRCRNRLRVLPRPTWLSLPPTPMGGICVHLCHLRMSFRDVHCSGVALSADLSADGADGADGRQSVCVSSGVRSPMKSIFNRAIHRTIYTPTL